MVDSKQEKNPNKFYQLKKIKGSVPFFLGVIVALVFGWYVFPKIMYTSHKQPVAFSHDTHINNGLDCSSCHYIREDGSFSGIPTTAECANCHSDLIGESPEEKLYFEQYASVNKEVQWIPYQKQPDNVFFSHAAHSLTSCNVCHEFTEKELCMHCHIDVTESKNPQDVRVNILTGYSKNTMKMWKCEECHAEPNHREGTNANNACFVCHK